MIVFIEDLHILHARELLQGCHQGLGNAVCRPIGLAIPRQIHRQHAVVEFHAPIGRKSIAQSHQALGLFLGTRAPEVLIQRCREWIGAPGDQPRDGLIEWWHLTADRAGVREVQVDLGRGQRGGSRWR